MENDTDKEFEKTKKIADRILDEPYKDPDDDESVLARQFLWTIERIHRREQEVRKEVVEIVLRELGVIENASKKSVGGYSASGVIELLRVSLPALIKNT